MISSFLSCFINTSSSRVVPFNETEEEDRGNTSVVSEAVVGRVRLPRILPQRSSLESVNGIMELDLPIRLRYQDVLGRVWGRSEPVLVADGSSHLCLKKGSV